ncbi:MAG: pilus assembly protein PilM [Deltaproteobacteria bacterium]|nr:pilus assembly protein PilM [Deltaproteobacteria bacterium]
MPEKILGLDIGTETIKAVQVMTGLKGYRVTRSALVDIEEAGGPGGALKSLLQGGELASGIYITAIPMRDVSFRSIGFPFKDRRKIQQALQYEMEQLIPRPADELLFDFIVREQTDRTDIIVAAAPRQRVGELVHLLAEQAAEAALIDIDAVPIAAKAAAGGGTSILLDIGSLHTTVFFLDKGAVQQLRVLSFGGRVVTETIAHALGMGSREAEQVKRSGDVSAAREELAVLYRKLVRDVQNTLEYVRLRGEFTGIPSGILLTGGGAHSPGLREELEKALSLPVEDVDIAAIEKVEFDEQFEGPRDPVLMNQALALATRESRRGGGFNFCVGEYTPKKRYEGAKRDIRWVAILAGIVLAFWGADYYVGYHTEKAYVDNLKRTEQIIFKETCPDVAKIVDPVHQLQVKIDEIKKASAAGGGPGMKVSVLDVLGDISKAVPPEVDFLITSFTYDGSSIEIKGETDNFNSVDTIKNSLGAADYITDVTVSSAKLIKNDSRVGFDLKMVMSG